MHRLCTLSFLPIAALTIACGSESERGSDSNPVGGGGSGGVPGGADAGGSAGSEPEDRAVYQAPTPDDCFTDASAGKRSLECEGLKFELFVPEPPSDGFAYRLLFDVHGFGMSGEMQSTHTRLRELAGPHGYIVIHPSAPAPAGGGLPSWSAANDDQVFAILQRAASVWHVDPKRIHFGGYSMGAWMTWRMICKHADVIASAAPIAGGYQQGGCDFTDAQHPSRAVPIFYTHGRTDGLVTFDTATRRRDDIIAYYDFDAATPETLSGSPDADHEWLRYTHANGAVFEFAEHSWETDFTFPAALKGHCFPGSAELLGCARDGATNAFDWGEAVLEFYRAHPMP